MIVVSHRGPVGFSADGAGGFTAQRGAGGVVSGLLPLLVGREHATWVAAAISKDDRAAVAAGMATVEGMDLHLLELDPDVHRLHYDIVSNSALWFLLHGLFDLPRRPRFDHRFEDAWEGYVAVNARFATEVASVANNAEIVLVQDYHLALVPGMLGEMRPDCRVLHFTHTPFCGPNSIRVLPDYASNALLSSMASSPCGFHTSRWRDAYLACAREVLGPAEASGARAFAASLGPDLGALQDVASSDAARSEVSALDNLVGNRAVVMRIDRIEPSKNIVRGFLAFDLLLQENASWRGRVVFVALLTPSREGLAEYLAYRSEVEQAAATLNARWGTDDWTPVIIDARDNYPRSIGALARYDVLLVNPVRDGLNLVAKEGPLLNQRDGVLCLSREAGAFEELAEAVIEVNPFDVLGTATALLQALEMSPQERSRRAKRLRSLAGARTPTDWLEDLLAQA